MTADIRIAATLAIASSLVLGCEVSTPTDRPTVGPSAPAYTGSHAPRLALPTIPPQEIDMPCADASMPGAVLRLDVSDDRIAWLELPSQTRVELVWPAGTTSDGIDVRSVTDDVLARPGDQVEFICKVDLQTGYLPSE